MSIYRDAPTTAPRLSKAEFAQVVQQVGPDPVALKQVLGNNQQSSLLNALFEKPILPELNIPERPGILDDIERGGYGVLRNVIVGSPVDAAMNLAAIASFGAGGAVRPLAKAALGGLSGAVGVRGLSKAFDSDLSTPERTVGALQGALGGLGAMSELRGLGNVLADEAGQIKIPKGFSVGTVKPSSRVAREVVPGSTTKALDPEIVQRAAAEIPAGSVPLEPRVPYVPYTTGRRGHFGLRRSNKTDITMDDVREIRRMAAEDFKDLSAHGAAKAISDKLKQDSKGLFAPKIQAVYDIIGGRTFPEKGMVVRQGKHTITIGATLAGPAASQFISDEQDPTGNIRLALDLSSLGGLAAAAHWQLKENALKGANGPQRFASSLAAGVVSEGGQFEDFVKAIKKELPDLPEKSIQKAWLFGVKKADELHSIAPNFFNEDFWVETAKKNPQFLDWWNDVVDVAKEVAPENPEAFLRVLAATSANNPPIQNLALAKATWNKLRKGQRLTSEGGLMKSIRGNVIRGLEEDRLGGRKINAMGNLMVGLLKGTNPDDLVIDRHILRGGYGHVNIPKSASEAEYEILARTLRRAAQKMGVHPRELQAAAWKTLIEDISRPAENAAKGLDWSYPELDRSFGQLHELQKIAPKVSRQDIAATTAKVFKDTTGESQGSTRRLGGARPSTGFAVAMFPERTIPVPADKFSPAVVQRFIEQNLDVLTDSRFAVGTWRDGDYYFLDITGVMPHREWAERLGKKFNQKGIADLSLIKEGQPFPDEAFISTGGTGEWIPGLPKVYDRAKDLDLIDIEHYSHTPGISELNPEFYGGNMAGEEKRRSLDPAFKRRVYAYAAGTPPEARFRGALKYAGKFPKAALYNIDEDPLGLRRKASTLTELENLIYDAGFLGNTFQERPGWFQIFSKLPVTLQEALKRGA